MAAIWDNEISTQVRCIVIPSEAEKELLVGVGDGVPAVVAAHALQGGGAIAVAFSFLHGERVAPVEAEARNIAFDVTPNRLLTGIVTENGVVYPPFDVNLKRAVLGE